MSPMIETTIKQSGFKKPMCKGDQPKASTRPEPRKEECKLK